MEQTQMIESIRQLAHDNEGVSAVLMYGSFTQGEADRYSDIEFYIWLREGAKINKREWISRIRPVEMLFTNEFGTDVVVFDNLIRGEFHFHPVSEINVISTWQGILDFSVRDKMKLVDKDSLLGKVLDQIEVISPQWNTPENIAWVADSMINNLIFAGNVIRRGEYARAVHLFFYLEKYLACMIRLHCGMTAHWLDPMKGFEKEIPATWQKRYANCIPTLCQENITICFNRVLILTKELFMLLDVPQHNKSLLEKLLFTEKSNSF